MQGGAFCNVSLGSVAVLGQQESGSSGGDLKAFLFVMEESELSWGINPVDPSFIIRSNSVK